MQREGINGIIASSPENFHYISGTHSHQHSVSRQPGFAAAFLKDNSDANAIVMDFEAPALMERQMGLNVRPYDTWVGVREENEIIPGAPAMQNKTDKVHESFMDVLIDTIGGSGLAGSRLGVEEDFLPVSFMRQLKEKLPAAEFVNVSPLFILARSVKSAEETSLFRELNRIASQALYESAKHLQPGMSERDVAQSYRKGVTASRLNGYNIAPSAWSTFNSGPNSSRLSLPGDRILQTGDVFKFDGGVNAEFDFYTTDFSRAWIVGKGKPGLKELKERLHSGLMLMLHSIKPGLSFSELFDIGFEHVKAKYPAYKRGHLGHSISMGPQTAEAPFISPGEKRLLEEGMVLCVEVPCYVRGIGGFNLEDMVLVTAQGCEVLSSHCPHFMEFEG